jgi:Spy/CpxP family protein refolding chaperone
MNLDLSRRAALLLALAVSTATALHAQGGHRGPSPEDRGKMLQTELNLTDDQTAKLVAIFRAEAACLQELRLKSTPNILEPLPFNPEPADHPPLCAHPAVATTKAKAIRDLPIATQQEIRVILTPQQWAAYQQLQVQQNQKSGKKVH